ncbi:hypothetical protein BGY98DRAFT_1008941, partial [Russula aff. rugulosa BPL654]
MMISTSGNHTASAHLKYFYLSLVTGPCFLVTVRSASELRRPSATYQNCIVLPVLTIIILPPSLPHLHRFIIVRHLDLRCKITANELKTVPPSEPPVLYPFSDSLPSCQTLDNDNRLLPQGHNFT